MKLAIFNSLPFHFEMFGYIIYFCKIKGYSLTIYSPSERSGWREFYTQMFPGLVWRSSELYFLEKPLYTYTILTTDDDPGIPESIIRNNKILCIDHYYKNRRPSIDMSRHIATRPFSMNYRPWALPCYPMIGSLEKNALISKPCDFLDVVILGGSNDYSVEQICRLKSDSKIRLHVIARNVNRALLASLEKNFTLCIYQSISTEEMMKILKESKYVMADVTTKTDHITGVIMSGSVPLAFSTLNTLILSRYNNNLYEFETAVTFDLDSKDPIFIKNEIDEGELNMIQDERKRLIESFHSLLMPILIN
jgi:hypothetical protein